MTFGDLNFQNIVFYFVVFLFYENVIFFYCVLSLNSYVVISESHFDLNVVYDLQYFYFIYCVCDDNNSCRCRHRSIRHWMKEYLIEMQSPLVCWRNEWVVFLRSVEVLDISLCNGLVAYMKFKVMLVSISFCTYWLLLILELLNNLIKTWYRY
jgi:hypothetical protein